MALVVLVIGSAAFGRTSVATRRISRIVNDQQNSALPEVNGRGEEPGDRLARDGRRRRLSPLNSPPTNAFNVSASLQGFNIAVRAIELRLRMAPTVNFTRALSARSPWKAERAFDLAGLQTTIVNPTYISKETRHVEAISFSPRAVDQRRLTLPPAALLLLMLSLLSPIQLHSDAASPRLTLRFESVAPSAIEEVYWRNSIWPKDNPQPKPRLDDILPEATLRAKVEDYLRLSNALEKYWQRPVTGEQLQAEMERMARDTKHPEVLRELWAALGNDPLVIAECMARPALAEHLARKHFAAEPMHDELRQRAAAELARVQSGADALQTSGHFENLNGRRPPLMLCCVRQLERELPVRTKPVSRLHMPRSG
jgi:hypothetical protein